MRRRRRKFSLTGPRDGYTGLSMAPAEHTSPSRIITAILALAVTAPVIGAGCSAAQRVKSYKQSFTAVVASRTAPRSPVKIDQHPAYAVYFRLDRAVRSIRVGITAEYIADIAGTRKQRKVYFVIEKMIDTSQFKNREIKYIFSDLGRNFDTDWTRVREIELASVKNDLFRSLDGNSMYRIRYTTFSNEDFDFTIKIEADCGVAFVDEPAP